jgi:hypothetical protein
MDPFAHNCALAWPPLWAPNGRQPGATTAATATPSGTAGKRRRPPRRTPVEARTRQTAALQQDGWTLEAVLLSF